MTVHSGSRNPGHTIASHYNHLSKVEDTELGRGFFHLNGDIGQAYLADMQFMMRFAAANRQHMLEKVFKILNLGWKKEIFRYPLINEHHNHATVTPEGVLHRKGAIEAHKQQAGVIPGNMRDGVFITEGLGNVEFLNSASHGAGRTMSRTAAKKAIDVEVFQAQMEGISGVVGKSTLDEAPDAYKDIQNVIRLQEGINIKVTEFIKTIINVKANNPKRRRK